jgi:hypothetical protein
LAYGPGQPAWGPIWNRIREWAELWGYTLPEGVSDFRTRGEKQQQKNNMRTCRDSISAPIPKIF